MQPIGAPERASSNVIGGPPELATGQGLVYQDVTIDKLRMAGSHCTQLAGFDQEIFGHPIMDLYAEKWLFQAGVRHTLDDEIGQCIGGIGAVRFETTYRNCRHRRGMIQLDEEAINQLLRFPHW